jgi:CheY-like chemotaxis protein
MGYSELLLEELPPGSSNRADVEEIRKAGESAATLTRQLLTFSRHQIVEPQLVDLNEVVNRVSSMLKRLIGEDIELSAQLSAPLDGVRADPGQIEQIVVNLAVNARDAMPDGGRLTIQTSNVVIDEAFAAQHPGVATGPHVLLSVSDSGIGMDQQTRAHLFEPFFTTKRRGEGTGLGLSTVYGIVKQSGGMISVYSEPGHGASFKILLPTAAPSAERDVERPAAASLSGSETILVAEDQPEVRSIMRAILSRHGYKVLIVPDGETALQALGDQGDAIDLLLTDVVMPTMGGAELVRRIAGIAPRVKVLYASGYTEDGVVRQGVVDRGIFFLQKPFSSTALLTKVREVLDSTRPSHL